MIINIQYKYARVEKMYLPIMSQLNCYSSFSLNRKSVNNKYIPKINLSTRYEKYP